MPKISIILPTYNGERFLRESLDSCLAQTYTNWELIIVDDCSTDHTMAIINAYAKKDGRIHVISNKTNKKLPASLNAGFSVATGDYLTWTSDDNYYAPAALERMAAVLDKDARISFVYANMNIIDEDGKILSSKPQNAISTLYYGSCIGACFLYRKSLYQKFGEYDTNLFCVEDYEFWMRLWSSGVVFFHLNNAPLYFYRNNSASLTVTKHQHILEKTFELKLMYWNRVPLSSFAKCSALYKCYRKTGSSESLEKIYKKHPVLGRLFKICSWEKKN